MNEEEDMKPEYDFRHVVRGEFYYPGAVIRLPIYLDEEQGYLAAAADRKGTSLSGIVNDLLRREIATAEQLK